MIELAVAVNGQDFVAERRLGYRLRTDDGGEDDADGSMVPPDEPRFAYDAVTQMSLPFPGPGREWRISTGGGSAPRWHGGGRELYYVGRDNRLMAVPITLPSAGDAIEHGTPVPLFPLQGPALYVPWPDGQKFLVKQVLEAAPTPPITVIMNWQRK